MIRELAEVILECDLPDHGLARGDVGTVVLALLSVDAIEGSGICGYPDQTRTGVLYRP